LVQETKLKTKKVLVIDDDVLLARLIEHNLSQIEVEVLKAYTGYDGISMVRSQQPDLVILETAGRYCSASARYPRCP
jgi:DNA-binding response OmpR family regulator